MRAVLATQAMPSFGEKAVAGPPGIPASGAANF